MATRREIDLELQRAKRRIKDLARELTDSTGSTKELDLLKEELEKTRESRNRINKELNSTKDQLKKVTTEKAKLKKELDESEDMLKQLIGELDED